MKITLEKLRESGYRKYTDSLNKADSSFQKKIKNNKNETMYFMNIHMYDFSKYSWDFDINVQYESEVGFYKSEEDYFRVIRTANENESIQDIESFYKTMYNKMNCIPDVHNN